MWSGPRRWLVPGWPAGRARTAKVKLEETRYDKPDNAGHSAGHRRARGAGRGGAVGCGQPGRATRGARHRTRTGPGDGQSEPASARGDYRHARPRRASHGQAAPPGPVSRCRCAGAAHLPRAARRWAQCALRRMRQPVRAGVTRVSLTPADRRSPASRTYRSEPAAARPVSAAARMTAVAESAATTRWRDEPRTAYNAIGRSIVYKPVTRGIPAILA